MLSEVRIFENPMIALSGVRSSWLTVARTRPLSASAFSARSRACFEFVLMLLLPAVISRITAIDRAGTRRLRPRGGLRRAISTQITRPSLTGEGIAVNARRNCAQTCADPVAASLSALR